MNDFNTSDILVHTSFETVRLYNAYERIEPWSVRHISPTPVFENYYGCAVPAPSALVVLALSFMLCRRRRKST